jgi:hypothetical protein
MLDGAAGTRLCHRWTKIGGVEVLNQHATAALTSTGTVKTSGLTFA